MNRPMSQFEVIGNCLTVIDTTRWDYWIGFRRIVRKFQ